MLSDVEAVGCGNRLTNISLHAEADRGRRRGPNQHAERAVVTVTVTTESGTG